MCKRTASLFLTFVILISFFSIGTAQEPVEPPPVPVPIIAPPTEPLTQEELLAIAEANNAAFNARELDQMLDSYMEDVITDYVPAPPPMVGKEAIRGFLDALFQAFPDMQFINQRLLASENIVVSEYIATGTFLGEWAGMPPTGVGGGEVMHLGISDFEGDKIKQETIYMDNVTFMVEVGLMPATELPELVPSFQLPAPELPGLPPLEAAENGMAVWNTHDLVSYAKLFHPDAEILIAPFGVPMDLSAFIASQELYFLAYSDLQEETVRIVDMGDGWVLAEIVFIGTNDGPYFGVPATGNSMKVGGAWIGHYDADGLVTNMNVYWDHLTTLTQLGLFPPPSETEANKELARRYLEEAWNQQNLELAAEIVSPEIVGYVPEGDLSDPEIASQHIPGTLAAFPDFHITIEDMMAEGDKVGVRYTTLGTHEGPLMGTIPPTGKQVTSTGIAIFQIADGKIVGAWSMADMLGMMQQIGVITPGRPAPENYMWGTLSEVTGDPGTPEANEALITRLIDEFWNQGNLDISSEIFSDDLVSHNPPISAMYPSTVDSLKQYATDVFAAFPDFQVVLDDLILEGDRAMGRWTATGTHEGEFLGIPATGKYASVSGITIYRFADGKMVEFWWAWDALGLMQQLTPEEPPLPEGLVLDEITSPSLEGNLLGDPATRNMAIYLPPDYDTSDTRYPVVYLIHGSGGNHLSLACNENPESVKEAFTLPTDFPEAGFASMIDELIASGTIQPMIIVMPDISNLYGGSYGINSVLNGNYEDYIVEDIVAYIDANYRTLPSPESRGIDGISMGGYVSMYLAMRHPDVFGAVSSHSGPLCVEAAGRGLQPAIAAENPEGITGPDPAKPVTSFMYMAASAMLPNLDNPPFFLDFPFDDNCQIIEEFMQRVGAYDPVQMIPDYIPELASLKGIFLDAGDKDELGLNLAVQGLSDALNAAGIEHELEIFDGMHIDKLYTRLAIALSFLSDTLVAEKVKDYTNVFFMSLEQGLNMISLPLEPISPHNARSFAEEIGATVVIRYDTTLAKFVGFTLDAPDDGFPIEGGEGYIVNVLESKVVPFTGAAWTNEPPVAAAPSIQTSDAWAFVVNGSVLDGEGMSAGDGGYSVKVKNLRTGETLTEAVDNTGYFAAASADLSRKAIISAGDQVEVAVMNSSGQVVSGPFVHDITLDGIRDAVVKVQLRLGHIIPEKSVLLQNYPNPFNPETWIPFHLKSEASVSIRIFSLSGQLIRTLDLGNRDAGVYVSRTKAAYWDGKNEAGEEVSSGIYFYSITAGDFSATKKMIMRK